MCEQTGLLAETIGNQGLHEVLSILATAMSDHLAGETLARIFCGA
jgi:hypothetical protein